MKYKPIEEPLVEEALEYVNKRFKELKMKKKKERSLFNKGYKLGYEEARRNGITLSFGNSRGLTEKEYEEVINYLVEKNVELRYGVMNGGLQIKKIF